MKNIYIALLSEQKRYPALILATITRTAGSTPQKPGSSALFGPNGLIAGTVGGGVLEGEVQKIALAAAASKQSGHFQFYLDKDISNKEEAICGGRVSVLVDASTANHSTVFEQMKQSLRQRESGILVTAVQSGIDQQVNIQRFWLTGRESIPIPHPQIRLLEPSVQELLIHGIAGEFREIQLPEVAGGGMFFLQAVFPPPQLVIAGAGHIGKALAHLGNLLDFEVTVIDDRQEYANPSNIPDADQLIVEDIGKAMQSLQISSNTYLVIVTRGHTNDAEALKPCIGSRAAYTGMIGSVNKIALMHDKFITEGWASEAQWKAICAPIGLPINSKTVEEIAISIAAQLVHVRNAKNQSHG